MSADDTTSRRPSVGIAVLVWLARLVAGGAFMLSGWAKSVDPWGFVYKIEDYLTVWGMHDVIPREIVLVVAVGLSVFEFVTGMLLATGSLRRTSPVFGAVIMACMLPLSFYIMVSNPVEDCGCFGDLWVISNTMTFVKNLVLVALIVILLIYNRRIGAGIRPSLQWIAIALSLIYPLILAFVGWQIQPMVDFRPYPIGSELLADAGGTDISYIYERNGEQRVFPLEALPDSTWTFVDVESSSQAREAPAIFDGDDEVTEDVLSPQDDDEELLILVVSEPTLEMLTRARFANELNRYQTQRPGGRMIAVVAATGEALDRWRDLTHPGMPVYSASDTSLKQLVRGTTALVRLNDGVITLKRNFATIPIDVLSRRDGLDSLFVVGDGYLAGVLSAAYLFAIALLWLLGAWYGKNHKPLKTIIRK